MLERVMTVLAGTALMVPAIALSASANDPVGKVVDNVTTTVEGAADGIAIETPVDGTVKRVVGGAGPGGGGTVIGGDVGPVRGTSPVVGYIAIAGNESLGVAPTYSLMGALADPTEWACAGSGTVATYTVTCLPVGTTLPIGYKCDVLHADVNTTSAGSSARTTFDCDSDGVGEAQTATVSGAGGHDSVWAVDGRAVTAFTCTIDHGRGDYGGGCGDPGTVDVTVG